MSSAESKENAAKACHWFLEGWTGNFALADEIFAPSLTVNGEVVGPEGPKRNCAKRLAGFPDLQTVVEEQIVSGDTIVSRVLFRGTHTGPYSGIAPTGKPIEARDITVWRFVDGKSVENWTVFDQFLVLQQLGVIPQTISSFRVRAGSTETDR
jgi:predicted ester cyclase